MSLGLLARQPLTWDSEAAAYILQVEAADGQSLEPGVARAINTFVIDCKVRGIWGAIKSCCLLSGARTLNGALRPLKGAAPTNFNFTNSDYNRETGLKGNGVDKYLNSNRLASAEPNNNAHIAIYVSQPAIISGLSQSFYIGSAGNLSGSRCISIDNSANTNRLKLSSNRNISYNASGFSSGFMGASSLGNNHIARFNQNSDIFLTTMETTHINNYSIHVFGDAAFGSNFRSNSRLSFYSIGEALDLRLLEQPIENYSLSLSRIFTNSYTILDSDAASYIAAVENADLAILSYSYRKALDEFVSGCKTDNIWTSLKASCILIGAKTLNGILRPLVGAAPTNNGGFTPFSYNRNLGLSNATRSGWLNSNRNSNADPQDDQHMSVYVRFPESTTTEFQYIGVGANDSGATHISSNANRRSRNGFAATSSPTPNNNTLLGITRSSPSFFISRTNNSNITHNIGSQAPQNANTGIFSRNLGLGITNATLAFYSIGTSIDLALLDNRVTILINELSAARSL